MSGEETHKPMCENFEPQAWRKTVCKNCFQSPEAHAAGSGEHGVNVSSGNVKDKREGTSAADRKSAASSIKDKYEQMEKDKYKPKEASHTLPRTKKASGLSLITEKYDQLDREAGKVESPTKNIPPPTPPKTYKKDGSMKGKFGSMENVSAEVEVSDNKLGIKFKFGSMENISNVPEKKKDPVPILTQKSKFGGSVDNISGVDKMKDGRQAMLNKLDSFQNEIKSGATSKSGQTVIHQQKDGHVDIITLPKRSTDTKIKDSSPQSKELPIKLSDKTEQKSKSEKPDLKLTNSKDKENTSLSKTGQKSKFDLKSTTSETEKQNELKGAKDLLSSNRLKTIKTEDSKEKEKSVDKDHKSGWKKPELKPASSDNKETKPISFKDRLNKTSDKDDKDKPADKDTKPGFKKPELKSSISDKEETKLVSFKDRLNKTTEKSKIEESKDSKDKPTEKDLKLGLKKPDLKPTSKDKEDTKPTSFKDKLNKTGDGPKKDELSKPSLNLKDQLESPSVDKDKLKEDLKSPSVDKGNLKDQLKSPSVDKDKTKDQLNSPNVDKDKLKVDLKSPSVDKGNLKDQLKSPFVDKDKSKDQLKSPTVEKDKLKDDLKSPSVDKGSLKDQLKSPSVDKDKLKDDLKSPSVDKDPLSKLKEKLKSPTPENENKQAPSWKDRLKSPSADTEKKVDDRSKSPKGDTKNESELKPDLSRKTVPAVDREKSKSPINIERKQLPDTENGEKKPDLSLAKQKDKIPIDKNTTISELVDKSKSTPEQKSKLEKDTELNKPEPALDREKAKSPINNEKKQTPCTDNTEKKSDQLLTKHKEENTTNKEPDDKSKSTPMEKSKLDNDTKVQDKNTNDLKSKFNKTSLKTGKDEDTTSKSKTFDLRNSLKKASDKPSTDKDAAKVDTKKKFELPSLKSNKTALINDKNKDADNKTHSTDAKPADKFGNKFEPKFKLNKTNEPKSNITEEKTSTKAKFELPKLKSKTDPQDDSKSSLKSKFEPKSKLNETKTDSKNKFEIPNLKKLKSPENEEQVNDKNNSLKAKDTKESLKMKERPSDVLRKSSKDAEKSTDEMKVSTNVDSDYDFQINKESNKGESRNIETSKEKCLDKNAPETSGISKTSFGTVSSDSEVVSGDACAEKSTRDSKSPLHVDTQVFTSSRSKTAGVSSLDDSNFDDNTSGFSGLGLTKSNKTKSPPKDKIADTIVNGDIALEHYDCSNKKETKDSERTIGSKYSDGELERLRAELLNMTERCQNLETENEMLRSDLNNKALTESTAKKQRDEVECAIKGLRSQLKSMEDKCSQLESENINMMNDLKAKHEINQNKPHTKESEEMDDKLTAKEKLMEDLMEENDQLKQEINELKVEMEEMYDSFRDQEAEEFREIQKELEYTAKNCRILQFKLRKMERRNEQTEKDKNQFEERLRKLQNSFQDRDAVSHIHSLEDELRVSTMIFFPVQLCSNKS